MNWDVWWFMDFNTSDESDSSFNDQKLTRPWQAVSSWSSISRVMACITVPFVSYTYLWILGGVIKWFKIVITSLWLATVDYWYSTVGVVEHNLPVYNWASVWFLLSGFLWLICVQVLRDPLPQVPRGSHPLPSHPLPPWPQLHPGHHAQDTLQQPYVQWVVTGDVMGL